MTIVVFLLDTSASMAQRSYVGVTYLEFARQFVEAFLKVTTKDFGLNLNGFLESP